MALTGGGLVGVGALLAGAGGFRAQAEVFDRIFVVFLGLGTLVGVVVVSYTLYNAYKYRHRDDYDPAPDAERPELGELPSGGGKGKKLFLSFGISAIIVLSLVLWTYASLLYVESAPAQAAEQGEDVLDVHVEGFQFGWEFTYPNGYTDTTLRVPEDRMVNLTVTTRDVFHNFGIPELRVKSDAIPGQTTHSWFIGEEPGNYTANCYELCGSGHSYMNADVQVMEPDAYAEWYADTEPANGTAENGTATNESAANGTDGSEDGGSHAIGSTGTRSIEAGAARATLTQAVAR